MTTLIQDSSSDIIIVLLVMLGSGMVNAKLCEKVRLVFFFASPRPFDFCNCDTWTLRRSDVIYKKQANKLLL